MGKKDQKFQFIDHTPNEMEHRKANRKKEVSLARKVILSIVATVIVVMTITLIVGYNYVQSALKPYDSKNVELVQVEIPVGSSTKEIAKILEENKIIKNAFIFSYYVKTNNAAELKAGYYNFSPSMTLDTIIDELKEGGTAEPGVATNKVLVKEGLTVDQVADAVAESTKFTKEEFMALMVNEEFLTNLANQFPQLLTDTMASTEVKYHLEGYLFPATYDYDEENATLESLVVQMVNKTDTVMRSYYATIAEQGKTVHEVLTLASIIEKEGVTFEDRQKIASVFYNRLDAGMMIQSDITVLYALGEHKEVVTLEDLEVDSPYNLYKYQGIGPGPYDSPGEESIEAALEPAETDYYYFVADLDTGNVYFAETYEEHMVNQEKYVDSRNN